MKYIRNTPWRSNEDRSDVLFSHTIVDSDGRRIARVSQLTDPVKLNNDSTLHEAATAKLLAAAPELHMKLLECICFLEQERKKIDQTLEDLQEFIDSIEGTFKGEEIEVPPLIVNPAAIEGRIAFLDSIQNKSNPTDT